MSALQDPLEIQHELVGERVPERGPVAARGCEHRSRAADALVKIPSFSPSGRAVGHLPALSATDTSAAQGVVDFKERCSSRL